MSPAFDDTPVGDTEGVDAGHRDQFIGDTSAEQRGGCMMPFGNPAMNNLIAFAKQNGVFNANIRDGSAECPDDLERSGDAFGQTWNRGLVDDNILGDKLRFTLELAAIPDGLEIANDQIHIFLDFGDGRLGQLRHQPAQIHNAPTLRDFAAAEPRKRHALEGNGAVGGRDAHKRATMRATEGKAHGYAVTFAQNLFNGNAEVGESGAKRLHQLAETVAIRGDTGRRAVVNVVFSETTIDQIQLTFA